MLTKIDAIVGLKGVPERHADVIIIDPPYNIGKDFGNNFDDLELDQYVDWCKQWIFESIRILKDTGTIYIYGFSEILAYISVEINLPKRWLIWYYTNKNMVSNKFWQRSHESILCVWKSKDRIFNLDNVREPYTDTFLKNIAGKRRKATPGRFSTSDVETVYKAHEKGALPRDVIKVPALAGGSGRVERFFYCKDCNDIFHKGHTDHNKISHPTQKPIELTKRLLMAAKPKEGGIAVIPFAGTGSELLAAKQLGMDAIGFEINEDYFIMANLLLNKGFPQTTLNT